MGGSASLRQGGWNGPAIAGIALAVIGVVVAVAAWLAPQSPSDADGAALKGADQPTTGVSPPAGNAANAGPVSSTPAVLSTSSPSSRYLAEFRPVAGSASLKSGAAEGHSLIIPCASGQSNDRFREVEWNIVGAYAELRGTVSVSGRAEPEARTQLEWFADDVRIMNDSTLKLTDERAFSAALDGRHELRVRVTCQDSAAVVSLLNTTISR